MINIVSPLLPGGLLKKSFDFVSTLLTLVVNYKSLKHKGSQRILKGTQREEQE
jgi:hypothetical protein